jgi:Tfp pilus assembly protein PilE
MVEMVAVFFALAVIALGAVALYRGIQDRSRDARAENLLLSVAGAQESYHQSRGQWATGTALDGIGRDGAGLTEGSSTGTDLVSIETVDVSGETHLGLAVLVEPGRCMTYLVAPPEINSDSIVETVELSVGETCTWSDAT